VRDRSRQCDVLLLRVCETECRGGTEECSKAEGTLRRAGLLPRAGLEERLAGLFLELTLAPSSESSCADCALPLLEPCSVLK
jgi:3-deoxy-D-manno-octulosonic acid (KDO) 8-phosphate synthase